MREQSFSLVPFPDRDIPDITITGSILRKHNLLAVRYSLSGSLEKIHYPKPASQPARKDELWMSTCFEFFLAVPNQPAYWEFNLSPSGDWNVFRMDAYRRIGFREEPSIDRLTLVIMEAIDCMNVDCLVDLNPMIDPGETLLTGITCVIQNRDGGETYWALCHPGSQADFHARESFTIRLSENDQGERSPTGHP